MRTHVDGTGVDTSITGMVMMDIRTYEYRIGTESTYIHLRSQPYKIYTYNLYNHNSISPKLSFTFSLPLLLPYLVYNYRNSDINLVYQTQSSYC